MSRGAALWVEIGGVEGRRPRRETGAPGRGRGDGYAPAARRQPAGGSRPPEGRHDSPAPLLYKGRSGQAYPPCIASTTASRPPIHPTRLPASSTTAKSHHPAPKYPPPPATMMSVRALVAAALVAVAAVAATVPAASATAVCVTTTNKCCYIPFVCGVVVKKHTARVSFDCSHKVFKKVEVPCSGHGGGVYIVHRTYVVPRYQSKCYAQQHVLVSKTCFKDAVVLKYFAKVCYKEVCHAPIVSGSKPSDGIVGDGVDQNVVGSDPTGYFKRHFGY